MGPAINSKEGESQPFIAPDESFILFYRVFNQIPVALRQFQGEEWPVAPGHRIRSLVGAGGGLIVSPDGKYLFFGRRRTLLDAADADALVKY